MSLQFFTPNKSKTGGLLAVSVKALVGTFSEPGDRAVWFNLVKQTGWDESSKKGSFKDGAKIAVKFTLDEVGGFIQAIRNQRNFSFFHGFDSKTTTGTFNYFFIEKDASGAVLKAPREGFGLTVKKDGVEIKVSFNLAAAENLAEYLKFCLEKAYTAIYSEDKKNAEDWASKNEETKPAAPAAKTAPKKPKAAPEPEPEDPPTATEEDGGEVDF